MNVETILRTKGRSVTIVAPDARIAAAVALLRRHAIGALVVSRDGKAIDGILSERDVVAALADRGAAVLELSVAELMSRQVVTCRIGDSIADLAALMTERRIRHLPVVERGELVGIVSIGDVVKHRIDEVVEEASSMREFIASA
ncbi:MAG TPA: CBS domain-containing protein [Stellaceae bacterium]|nr:CBS domain-containing protein [Stellaceae bacterium]